MQTSQTTKRVLWGGAWILSVIAAFGAGFWATNYVFEKVLSTDYLTMELVQAIETQYTLELLDSGAAGKARESLNLQMDTHILTLAHLSEYSTSEKDREATDKLLRRVAKHRKTHKVVYPDYIASGEMREAQTMIEEILQSKGNDNKQNPRPIP